MLKQRVITALVLIPLVFGALFRLPIDPYSNTVIGILAIAAWEWARMAGCQHQWQRVGFAGVFVVACLLVRNFSLPVSLWQFPSSSTYRSQLVVDILLGVGICWWLVASLLVVKFPLSKVLWRNPLIGLGMGLCALVPAWVAFAIVRGINYRIDPLQGSYLLIGLLLIIWAADIGAYFCGKAFGRHKLALAVSPGKSVEGAIGGAICAVLVLPAYVYCTNYSGNYWWLAGATLVIVIISIIGDLTESMFKRVSGIKDSSNILPGHGGIYDRLDSLIAALPFFVVLHSLVLT